MSYQPKDVVTSEAEIRAMQPKMHPTQPAKVLDHLDPLCRLWIERSAFVVMATYDAAGAVDVSPKGDPAGFVQVLDRQTLAIPDRPGNHRFDSFSNILQTGRIGLMFLVSGRNEVVRVNGSAQILRDPELLERMQVRSHLPELAVLVHVQEAFYHCGKAIIRSGLWHPDKAAPIDGLPSYAEALAAHAEVDLTLEQIETRMAYNDSERLYKE